MATGHVVLPGSQRPARHDAVRIGDIGPETQVEVTVTVRGPELPEPTDPITPEDLLDKYGANQADIDKVASVLTGYGLTVEESSPATRSLRVSGSAAQIEDAFHPGLGLYTSPQQGEFRGRQGKLQIPAELDGIVTGVFGLDQRRVAHRKAVASPEHVSSGGHGFKGSLTPSDLEKHYAFPAGDAAGQVVAIAEFGGAYFPDDLAAFCAREGRTEPNVQQLGVGGVTPLTVDDIRQMPKDQRIQALEESIEVNMDVQIVAGLCPAAELVVLFGTFDQKGWVDLLNQVISSTPTPVALSVSWGLAEDHPDWSHAALQAINERLHAAALLGITVCVAAGDDGSGDQVGDQRAHVDFPASSPYVLAVGGTMLRAGKDVVWWDPPGERTQHGGGATGGGVSVEFARPSWQDVHVASVNAGSIDGRIVPDVSALAGKPLYDLIFLGHPMPNGGTSASAPLWASLLARAAATHAPARPPRFVTPLLYDNGSGGQGLGASAFVDVTSGNNVSPHPGRGYAAAQGFDAVSGWGVPNGEALAKGL